MLHVSYAPLCLVLWFLLYMFPLVPDFPDTLENFARYSWVRQRVQKRSVWVRKGSQNVSPQFVIIGKISQYQVFYCMRRLYSVMSHELQGNIYIHYVFSLQVLWYDICHNPLVNISELEGKKYRKLLYDLSFFNLLHQSISYTFQWKW